MRTILLVFSIATATVVSFAQLGSPNGSSQVANPNFPVGFAKQQLIATYIISQDLQYRPIPGDDTFTAVDPVHKIICPGTTGECLFQADAWVQFCTNLGPPDNPARISLVVDGNIINWYYAGELPTGYYCGQLSTSSGVAVPVGTHTVHVQVTAKHGGQIGYYNIAYRVYKR